GVEPGVEPQPDEAEQRRPVPGEQLLDRLVVPLPDPRQQVQRLRAILVQRPLPFTCGRSGRSTANQDYFPISGPPRGAFASSKMAALSRPRNRPVTLTLRRGFQNAEPLLPPGPGSRGR